MASSGSGSADTNPETRTFCPSPRFTGQQTDFLLKYVASSASSTGTALAAQQSQRLSLFKLLSQTTLDEGDTVALEHLRVRLSQQVGLRDLSRSVEAAIVDCAHRLHRPGSSGQVASVLDLEDETLLSMPREYFSQFQLDASAKQSLVNKLWTRPGDTVTDDERAFLRGVHSLVNKAQVASWLSIAQRADMEARLRAAVACSARISKHWLCTNPILGANGCEVVKLKIFHLEQGPVAQALRRYLPTAILALFKLLLGITVDKDEQALLKSCAGSLFNNPWLVGRAYDVHSQQDMRACYEKAVSYVTPPA